MLDPASVPRRLSKHAEILGVEGIERVRKTRLAIVGMSGNGTPFALFAALAGFVNLTLIDPDRLDETNRNRFLLGGMRDVGRYKVDVAKQHLDQIDEEMRCAALPVDARSGYGKKALREASVIISAVDSNGAREFLQQRCAGLGKPLLDIGSGGIVESGELKLLGSRVSVYAPGTACLYHQTLDREDPFHSAVSFVAPNVVAGAVALELLLSRIVGLGDRPNFVLYDSLRHSLVPMEIGADPSCEYCTGSQHPDPRSWRTSGEE